MYRVVLDLEMNDNIDEQYRSDSDIRRLHEIIQIGAVLLDNDNKEVDSLSLFVKPKFGKLSKTISRLTGIVEDDLVNALSIEDALQELVKFIPDIDNTVLCTWSNADTHAIRAELRCKHIENSDVEKLLSSWIDVQKLYRKFLGLETVLSLDKAVFLSGLDTEESFHNALSDARYTGQLYKIISGNDDSDKAKVKRMKSYFSTPPLGVSLGKMFDFSKFAID